MPRSKNNFLYLLIIMLVISPLGCAPQSTSNFEANYYPQCRQPIERVQKAEKTTSVGTIIGAVGGALIGTIVGLMATGKVEGAIGGAMAGGAIGAVGVNMYGKREERKQAEYLQAMARQLGEDTSNLNNASAAAKLSLRCYDDEFKLATSQYRAGQITRHEYIQRYNEVRSGIQETTNLLGNVANSLASRDQEYRTALATETQNNDSITASANKKTQKKKRKAKNNTAKPSIQPSPIQREIDDYEKAKLELTETKNKADQTLDDYKRTVDAIIG